MDLRKAKNFLRRENITIDEGGKLVPMVRQGFQKRKPKPPSPKGQQEYKLYANYETMFSDTRPRGQLMLRRPNQKLSFMGPERLKEVEDIKQKMEVQGSHRTLFYRQPSRRHYSTVIVHLDADSGTPKKVTFESESDPTVVEVISKKEKSSMVIKLPSKTIKMESKSTQTDFRESEAQTLPWKHEIIAGEKMMAELLSLDWFTLERNFPPGMEEVALIEKARQKLAWESVVSRLRGKENEAKRKWLVLRMAVEENASREKKIDEVNRERLSMAVRMMKEAKERFEAKVASRLERSYSARRMENDVKIEYWRRQLLRQLRKIKSIRDQCAIKGGKPNILTIHLDKTSQLYAPTLRDGENPSLGHEKIDIQCRYLKRFHGLNILEKYLAKVLQPEVIGFDFEEASKPKMKQLCSKKLRQRSVREVEDEGCFESLSLKIPVPAPTPEAPEYSTPKTERLRSDSEEDLHQASLLLGKIIKGRAIQTEKFLEIFKTAAK